MLRTVILVFLSTLVGFADVSFAATKAAPKKKPTIITPADYFTVTVDVKIGKKTESHEVACYKERSGTVKPKGNNYIFTSYVDLTKALASARRPGAPLSTKELLYKKLSRTTACKKDPGNPGGDPNATPTPTPKPGEPSPQSDFLSLDPYAGPFGREQAKILMERFAFGATPERVDLAVQEGLGATVQRLTTWVDEPALDATFEDLTCDAREANEQGNKQCDAANPNDFSFDGLRYAIYAKIWYGQNPYFMRMYFFLQDKFMAAVTRNLTGCTMHAARVHHNLLMDIAKSGDFKDFSKRYSSDLLGAIIALNLQASTKFGPNEDYAREIMERGILGKANLDGIPNYTDADVAEMARVFTGWKVEQYKIGGNDICYAAWVPALHDETAKTIFRGTPYEKVVYEPDDVIDVLFARPEASERIAHQLWYQFINPFPTNAAIRNLAKIIRDNNFNLNLVMRQVMVSKAVFASKSRKSLIKDPIELVFTFLRETNIPYQYRQIHALLGNLGQVPLNPPTVFGWDPLRLADEFHTLAWLNGVKGPIFQNLDDLLTDRGFSFHDRLLANISTSADQSGQVARSFSDRLMVKIPDNLFETVKVFLDYDLRACSTNETCQNAPRAGYKLVRNQLDTFPTADPRHNYKMQALLAVLATVPEFRLK